MKEEQIMLITLDYPPQPGGVARYLSELVLASEGRMEVIVPEEHEAAKSGLAQGGRLFGRGWPRWWPMVGVCKRLRNQTSCLLVSHVLPVGTAALLSQILGGPNYAVLFHGLDLRLAHGIWKRILLALVCLGARACFTNSQTTARELTRRVPWVRPLVIMPGLASRRAPSRSEARQRLGLREDEALALSIARLVSRKGIDVALEVMARVQTTRRVRYVVIGEGDDRRRLEKLAGECGVQVEWHGNVADLEKWDWLAAADVFLLPVREDERDVEGFGIVFLEAALAGVPAVAGRSGGVGEAVLDGETGILVDPRDVEGIAAALNKLLDDKALRAHLGERAKKRALSEFQWKDRWETICRRLLS